MRDHWIVDSRTLWFLGLYGILGLCAFGAGGFFFVRGIAKERHAIAVIQRADSLHKAWAARGCTPQ